MLALVAYLALIPCNIAPNTQDSISLAGKWGFQLDPQNQGIERLWYNGKLSDVVTLPGSLDENHKGPRETKRPDYWTLSRLYNYTGPAWYEKDVVIPESWKGHRVTLFLERCHWETQVWLDGKPCDTEESLCVSHVHELGTNLKPGTHHITLRIDNSIKYDIGTWGHSITEHTQTNWNGVVGRIELRSTPPVWVKSVQVYPNNSNRTMEIRAHIGHAIETQETFQVTFQCGDRSKTIPHSFGKGDTVAGWTLKVPDNVKSWSEFNPQRFEVKVTVAGVGITHEKSVLVGLRDIAIKDKRIELNGAPIFLRGTLECCIFPLTGYPPTSVDPWLRIFKIAKSYGLNHMRFHSWCPPEAAFEAADRMGFLLQVECPLWSFNVGQDPKRDRFIEEEYLRILDTYGNHPSFGFLCVGNELQGKNEFLENLVRKGRQHDPRHLYTGSTAWSQTSADQYRVGLVRGPKGPGTEADFAEDDAQQPVPIVSHEIGQWCVFPHLIEQAKYTGVLRQKNFDLVREGLTKNGLENQAEAFTMASGKLAQLLYKDEIEAMLRTPGHGGFQLLDLHDFPGQGTALVGMLDPFWDSKGFTTSSEFSRFCNNVVPLALFSKRIYTTSETFNATVELANDGLTTISNEKIEYSLTQGNRVLASGGFTQYTVLPGERKRVGSLSVSMHTVSAPAKLTLHLKGPGENRANNWDIWVYPVSNEVEAPKGVSTTQDFQEALNWLSEGKKVLFFATPRSIVESVAGSFFPAYWSPVMFESPPGTMGMLCDNQHPIFKGFPTAFHTDWQWFDLLKNSRAIVLDQTPKGFKPIVQPIDKFNRNHKLGSLFEAKVGKGSLLVCAIDLWEKLDNRPEARQLLRSICAYIGSEAFLPQQSLTEKQLQGILKQPQPSMMQKLSATIVKVDSEDTANGNLAANVIDGDAATFWHTQWQPTPTPMPHEVVVGFKSSPIIESVLYTPRQDMTNGRVADYSIYISDSLDSWGEPVAKGTMSGGAEVQRIKLTSPKAGRYLRFVIVSEVNRNPFAAIAELDVVVSKEGLSKTGP